MSNAETPLIKLLGVSRHYAVGPHKVGAVDDVSLEISKGKMVAVMGPSGCGKTTLLNLLGALDRPTEGHVFVDSIDVGNLSGREEVHYRRNKVGFVFQTFNLIPNISALENVMLPMELNGVSSEQRKARAQQLLLEVVIPAERFSHRPLRLSGGEQQRVAIARALANDPPLILADEPTGNLDRRTGRQIVGLLVKLVESQGRTVVVVTHDTAVATKASLHLLMADGKISGRADAETDAAAGEEDDTDLESEEDPQEELTIDGLFRDRQQDDQQAP